jgi:GNAT superfamily N-acetyltransferase
MTKREIVISEWNKNPNVNRTHLAKQSGLSRQHVIRIINEYNLSQSGLHSSLLFEQEMQLITRLFSEGIYPIKFPDCTVQMLVNEHGVFSVTTFDSFNKQMVYIRNIYVKKEFRKKEIGTKFIQGLIDKCSELGIPRIETEPTEKSIGFFTKFGFDWMEKGRMFLIINPC